MLNLAMFLGALSFAHAEPACPDFSGTYSDRELFLNVIAQPTCGELAWTSSVHPKNPNPPAPKPPETTKFLIDCKKHQNLFQMESICWNGRVLETWTYAKNTQGTWAPFSIRRLYLSADGSTLHDDAYLTDASGAERKYLSSVYNRQNP